jgi:collagen type IV alpha-3-binding protein
MFKSTSNGMMLAVEDSVSMANRREEEWRKRLAKANEKRRHFEKLYQQSTAATIRDTSGPDMQEGPHSVLTEEEWFDAIAEADAHRASVDIPKDVALSAVVSPSKKEPGRWQKFVTELLKNCNQLREDSVLKWEEVLQDQNLVVDRVAVTEDDGREHEKSRVTGVFPVSRVCSDHPTKPMCAASASACPSSTILFHALAISLRSAWQGVTAGELIEYYSNPDVKQNWDSTMETFKIIEQDHECDLPWSIEYYTYRRVWPAQQRESVLIIHSQDLGNEEYVSVTQTIKYEKVSGQTPSAGGWML